MLQWLLQVSVSVDTPASFLANAPDVPLGSVRWRRQQLAARGYKVVSVPQQGWQEVAAHASTAVDAQLAQQAYLLRLLREAGVALPVEG